MDESDMKQGEIDKLIKKYLAGKATEKEREALNRWYNSFNDENVTVPVAAEGEKKKTREKMLQEIKLRITGNENPLPATKAARQYASKPINPYATWLKIAASLLIVLSAVYIAYKYIPAEESSNPSVAWVTKSVNAGQKSKITLMDGTVVHLNSGSSIQFPESFEENSRDVVLEGEAFFEVAEDSSRPFKVTTGELTTTVLGTSFNINAYPDNGEVLVMVATGKVLVEARPTAQSPAKTAGRQILTPDQGAVFNTFQKNLEKIDIQVQQYIAWKDGWLIFEGRGLGEVVKVMERWYGVEIIIADEELKSKLVTLKQQDESLRSVLKILGFLAGFDYEIEKDQVTITKKKA